jgi:EmrB/QacA subfamily drug resistance transporter
MPLLVAILASFIAFLDGSIVNVALASIEDEFGGGLAGQQWIVDSYLLALGALILLAGAISDRVGRARSLRIGLVVFGFASLICALAPGVGWLIAARFLQGVGGALLVPSSLALINSTYAGPARSQAIGSWTGWTSVAFILGPLVGGLLVDYIGWRWVFAVNLLPVIVTLTLMRALRDPVPSVRGRLDIIGAALVALGLGGIVFALIEQPRLGWASPVLWSSLIVGAALIVAFLIRQRRVASPLLPLSLFRARNFAAGNATTAAVYAAVGLGIWIITLFLLEVVQLPATIAGLATLPVAVASILFARLFGSLSGRYGPRFFMAIGPLIAASGFAWMLTASVEFNFWTQLLPGIVLYGFGLTITVAPLTAAVLGAVPSAQSGIGSAVNNAIARVAGLIAVAIAGPIIGNQLDLDGFHRLVLTTAGLLAVGGIVAAVGIRNTSHRAVDASQAAQCSDRPVPGAALVATVDANP